MVVVPMPSWLVAVFQRNLELPVIVDAPFQNVTWPSVPEPVTPPNPAAERQVPPTA